MVYWIRSAKFIGCARQEMRFEAGGDDADTPFTADGRALPQHLLLEIADRLHRPEPSEDRKDGAYPCDRGVPSTAQEAAKQQVQVGPV
jgi:hypothetical protein